MRVPVRWLQDLVDTGLPAPELAHRLTMAGLEAEKIDTIGSGWDKVFVGHVDKVERHPDADRLVLATVSAGEHLLTVVTGAPNIARDQKVAIALAGARLFDGHSDEPVLKTLKPGAIRGIRSEGMVCSEKELGLSNEHEGILVLEPDAPVGAPLADYLGDTVIEFEITPNLVHAFSVLGIAREASAITKASLHIPAVADLSEVPDAGASLAVVDAPDLCPRYLAVVIDGLTVGPSPTWLARRLTAAGLRPINNVVDVTNYVMLEWGQPLHAFDRGYVAGGQIIVRRAKDGETMETLDHQRRVLNRDVLVIADAEKAVGIAGVMGGVNSEVTDETRTIVLESATFDMTSIRSTSRLLKLRTDASARFERGLDPYLALDAAARAVQLLLEMSPGSRVVEMVDVFPDPPQKRQLTMTYGEFERLLGVHYETELVLDALARLGFAPMLTGDSLTVRVPTWRSDVQQPADIVEEAARIIGYDSIPETLPLGRATPVHRDSRYQFSTAIRASLAGLGGFECVTYVGLSDEQLAAFANPSGVTGLLHSVPKDDLLRLINPVQSDREILRPTLIPSLLETAASNLKHESAVRLFEIARVYLPSEQELPEERLVAGVVFAGERKPLERFGGEGGPLDFFDLKGALETVLARAGVTASFEPASNPGLHPGRTAVVVADGQRIGVIGELRPDAAAAAGIETPRVVVAELDLDLMLALHAPVTSVVTQRFLPVQQDYSIIVQIGTPAADVEAALRFGAGPLVSKVELFDVYQGPRVGEGKKNLTYRVTYTARDRTLTDSELIKVREKIKKTLAKNVAAELTI